MTENHPPSTIKNVYKNEENVITEELCTQIWLKLINTLEKSKKINIPKRCD